MLADTQDSWVRDENFITFITPASKAQLACIPLPLSSSVGGTTGTQVDDLWVEVAAEEH